EREVALERALEELEDGVVARELSELRARDVALEEEDLGQLLLARVLRDLERAGLVRADQGLDDRREVEEAEVALELLARGPRHLERRGLEPLGEHEAEVAGEGRERLHEVEEHRLLEREQDGLLRRPHGRAPRRAGEERELAQDLARAEVGHGHRLDPVRWGGQHLEDAALDDEQPVALLALLEDDLARPQLQELALSEDGLHYLLRLVLEEVGAPEEGGIDGRSHRGARLYPRGSAGRTCVNIPHSSGPRAVGAAWRDCG